MDNQGKGLFVTATAVLSSLLTYLFGGPDVLLTALLTFVVLDYLTGVIAAFLRKELSSRVGFAGIFKKLLLFAVVAVAVIVDRAGGLDGVLRGLVIGALLANEGLSILENAAEAGVPIPKKLLSALGQLRERGDGEEGGGQP